MTKRLTEVARKAGVSEATVSRVLNGRDGVAEATRTAVLTALDVLGYERPSKLRGERARLVGLVLPELQNPIFPALAEVVTGSLAQRGFTPALCARTIGGVSESAYVEMLLDHQVSGVIFAGGSYALADASHEHYRRLTDRGLPVVLVNAGVDELGFPRVSTDDAVAVEQAYGHLRSLGHERIGLVLGPEDHVPSRRKLTAMRRVIGWDEGAEWVERSSFSMEGARVAATKLVDRGVTGIICASDVLALGAIRAVRRLGRSVPDDVSVVGYDDSAFMTCTDPPLTTVRQPIETMGQAAVDLLVTQIEGGGVLTDELLFEPELVVRGSTAPTPRS
ncbi:MULTISPECIES: LacI family DNA-binding transcriptional regulator [unclassified Micromonospora]|uniref:LacI family DNA-binding transcriptional regulator n=1 Tax=unclassified Micromonospora TaxID=2617518 RepID=UPI0022B6E3CF|nr:MULTISPECIES: LacI family DNA-binding transcriptional regulator [unclassified Micromonospora]MCZ7421537.1 LacI family DNA-binding transcriptional regulator [Verrucosispora sp. WMMA2121]WBB93776.1 LacI family DNA-binding transcriptional regulator [Verrucosispora sp. WMMC514]